MKTVSVNVTFKQFIFYQSQTRSASFETNEMCTLLNMWLHTWPLPKCRSALQVPNYGFVCKPKIEELAMGY